MKLCVVSYTFEQGRRFCQHQGLDFQKVKLASTDANFFLPGQGFELGSRDVIVKYGPYYEGKNAHRVLHEIYSRVLDAPPREIRTFMLDEKIDWPEWVMERYGR